MRQYKVAKDMEEKKCHASYEKSLFEQRINEIKAKPKGERTVDEKAMLKQYDHELWEAQFTYPYDYDDDNDIYF